MTMGTHEFIADQRNAAVLISVNGELVPRREAVVSVFDSGFLLGDGVWEGLRLVNGGIPFLRAHIERLYEGAKAIFMDIGLTPDELVRRLFDCLDANRMKDGVHIRLMVTRGIKSTPYQDPRLTHLAADHRHHSRIQGAPSRSCSRRACSCSRSMCGAAIPTCRTRSSIPIPSSTASPPASRPPTPAPTRR